MVAANSSFEQDSLPSKSVDRGREKWTDNARDKSTDKTIETEPKLRSWMIVAAGAVVPLGLACAATVATYVTTYERVAVTAWVAVAVVGTASVIATAAASRRRIKSVERHDQGERVASRSNDVSRIKAE
ncbi:MAG: hypothetical protein AABP62_15240 [Planctomycetota bacterium]